MFQSYLIRILRLKEGQDFLAANNIDSKNLGLGVSIPYFWSVNRDKNFTFTTKLYSSENPLLLGEYHQAFKTSNFFSRFWLY